MNTQTTIARDYIINTQKIMSVQKSLAQVFEESDKGGAVCDRYLSALDLLIDKLDLMRGELVSLIKENSDSTSLKLACSIVTTLIEGYCIIQGRIER